MSTPQDQPEIDEINTSGIRQDDWDFLRTLFRGGPHKQTEARRCLFAGMCRILPLLPPEILAELANLGEDVIYRPEDVDIDAARELLSARGMKFRNDNT